MASLGAFKAAVREADPNREPDTFDLEGETFTVADRDLTIVMAQFASAASSGLDTAEMEGMAAMLDMLKGVVVDEDQARLVSLSKRVGLDGETLLEIVKTVLEANAGRPTQRQSDSQLGLSTTGESSTVSSPLGAVPPILLDPRVRELQDIEQVGMSLVV